MSLGAVEVIKTGEKDLYADLAKLTDGEMCDAIYDLVGNADTIDLLLKCIRPGGKVIALGYAADHFTVNCQELVIKEKEVLGLRGSTRKNLAESIALVETGKLTPYVSDLFRLEQINEALDFMRNGKGLGRSVITFE